MTNTRRVSALALAALILGAFTACDGEAAEPVRTETPSQTPSAPSSPASTADPPPSDTEVAEEAATQVVRNYFTTLDQLRQEPDQPLTALETVATSSHLAAQKLLIRRERGRKLHQVGSTQVVELRVESIDLNNVDPRAGRLPTAWVAVCWDVSDADLVDRNGDSVVASSRPDTGWTQYTVANYQWSTNPSGAWRITSGQDMEREPCEPA